MERLSLSICVVTYNCDGFIERFHSELVKSLSIYVDWEILYFDNSPGIDTFELLKMVNESPVYVFRDGFNYGFSKANNILIDNAKYEKILLLNPDVFDFYVSFWSELMIKFQKDTVLFLKLKNTDGSFQDCIGEPVGLNRIFNRTDYSSIASCSEVGMGIMAFMLTTNTVFSKVGLLDPDYPLYAEDMDWCYRAKKLGVKIFYEPDLHLTHVGGSSAKTKWSYNETRIKKYLAERIFIRKHFTGLYKLLMLNFNYIKVFLVKSGFY